MNKNEKAVGRFLGLPLHRKDEYFPFEMAYIYDHQYVGNVCTGFGGRAECEWFKLGTYEKCGASPQMHKKAKHRSTVNDY